MYVVTKWGFASVPPVTLAFLRIVVVGVLGVLLLDETLGETLGPGFAAGGVVMGVGVALVSTARTE